MAWGENTIKSASNQAIPFQGNKPGANTIDEAGSHSQKQGSS